MHVLKKNEECLPDELKFSSRETAVCLEKKNHYVRLCKCPMSKPGKGGNQYIRILLAQKGTCVSGEAEMDIRGAAGHYQSLLSVTKSLIQFLPKSVETLIGLNKRCTDLYWASRKITLDS